MPLRRIVSGVVPQREPNEIGVGHRAAVQRLQHVLHNAGVAPNDGAAASPVPLAPSGGSGF
jgi:hypothetical protein